MIGDKHSDLEYHYWKDQAFPCLAGAFILAFGILANFNKFFETSFGLVALIILGFVFLVLLIMFFVFYFKMLKTYHRIKNQVKLTNLSPIMSR